MVKYVISYSTYAVKQVEIEYTHGAFSYAKDGSGTTEGFLTVELYDSKEEAYRKSLEFIRNKIEATKEFIQADFNLIKTLTNTFLQNSLEYSSLTKEN